MRLLHALKSQTATSPAGLESSLDVFSRVRTKQDYAAPLGKFFTLYEPMEASLGFSQDWAALRWDFPSHQKNGWLRDDRKALGVPAVEIAAWNRCVRLPGTDNLGATIGCPYVIEGSARSVAMLAAYWLESARLPQRDALSPPQPPAIPPSRS